jgi:hypothetical protein
MIQGVELSCAHAQGGAKGGRERRYGTARNQACQPSIASGKRPQQRAATERYDAAMEGLLAELTDEELTAMIDRLEPNTEKGRGEYPAHSH